MTIESSSASESKETPLRWSRSVECAERGVSVFSDTYAASPCGVNAETVCVLSSPGAIGLAASVASIGDCSHKDGVVTWRAVLRRGAPGWSGILSGGFIQ